MRNQIDKHKDQETFSFISSFYSLIIQGIEDTKDVHAEELSRNHLLLFGSETGSLALLS